MYLCVFQISSPEAARHTVSQLSTPPCLLSPPGKYFLCFNVVHLHEITMVKLKPIKAVLLFSPISGWGGGEGR